MAAPQKYNRFIIMLISSLDQIGITIGFPVLTFLCFDQQSTLFAMSTSHATRSLWFGILSSAPHLVMMLTIPIFAILSDKIGRKKILLLGAFGVLFLSLATIYSILYGSIIILLIAMLFGGSFARTEPIALAAISDISTPKQKIVNMGYLQFAISAGALLGPIIGGFFAKRFFFHYLNFSFPFFIATLMAIITILFTQFKFTETFKIHKPIKTSFLFDLKELFNPTVGKISLVLILTQISWRIYYIFMPAVLKNSYHIAPFGLGIFLALIALWLSIGSTIVLKLLNKYFKSNQILNYAIWILSGGLLIAVIGCTLHNSTMAQTLIWFAAAPIAMGDVIAFCAINTLYAAVAHSGNQGKIMGICVTLASLVWTVTGVIGGALAGINIKLPIIVALFPLVLWIILPIKNYPECD